LVQNQKNKSACFNFYQFWHGTLTNIIFFKEFVAPVTFKLVLNTKTASILATVLILVKIEALFGPNWPNNNYMWQSAVNIY